MIATSSSSHEINIWKFSQNIYQTGRINNLYTTSVVRLLYLEDQKNLVLGDGNGVVSVVDYHSKKQVCSFKNVHNQMITDLILIKQDSKFVAASLDNIITIYTIGGGGCFELE